MQIKTKFNRGAEVWPLEIEKVNGREFWYPGQGMVAENIAISINENGITENYMCRAQGETDISKTYDGKNLYDSFREAQVESLHRNVSRETSERKTKHAKRYYVQKCCFNCKYNKFECGVFLCIYSTLNEPYLISPDGKCDRWSGK